ncbi:hypothetical protein P872_20830 [Rhodonellum psychrophilum GCM71 = DSM 17998]|uniref:Uncharacterized protein n=1 Tax=Rhodonellum psychrophilum GCM71 = DSM 17998 TaxID=1123057 RepID=U5BWW0_9BACT|nr:hypothetical protein P872_20830 [Rhodonellum psychrophilum GCM71 = DSM 17998]
MSISSTGILPNWFYKMQYFGIMDSANVVPHFRKPTEYSGTFGFCRQAKPKIKNQKNLNFTNS